MGVLGTHRAAAKSAVGARLWLREVYGARYDPRLEQDVQDVFIIRISVEGDALLVVDERRREFRIPLAR
jgi:hypothetical protein